MTDSAALVDLGLSELCDRWEVSRNAVKARARALGVELRRESSTRTVWPSEHLHLGDELHEHLKRPKATLANYSGPRLEPLPAAPLAAPERRSVPSGSAGSGEAMAALVAMVAAMKPAAPPPDPLATVERLHRAAELGAWLKTSEVAKVARCSASTVRNKWHDGYELRPGLLVRCREVDGRVWWRIVREAD